MKANGKYQRDNIDEATTNSIGFYGFAYVGRAGIDTGMGCLSSYGNVMDGSIVYILLKNCSRMPEFSGIIK